MPGTIYPAYPAWLLPLASKCFHRVDLGMRWEEAMPELWAGIQDNLGKSHYPADYYPWAQAFDGQNHIDEQRERYAKLAQDGLAETPSAGKHP